MSINVHDCDPGQAESFGSSTFLQDMHALLHYVQLHGVSKCNVVQATPCCVSDGDFVNTS